MFPNVTGLDQRLVVQQVEIGDIHQHGPPAVSRSQLSPCGIGIEPTDG